jgi:subtilase family serine protease
MRRILCTPFAAHTAAFLLFLAASVLSFGQTAPQDRIVQAIDQNQMTALRGNVHPLARPEYDQGRVNPGMEMPGLSIAFRLSPTQQTALDELIAQQQDPSSPNYRKWLTPEQYAARFGMSQPDLDRVTTWLQSQGFTGIQVSRSRTRISFNGTAARVEAAFRTEIHSYQVDGETHFANATEPAAPAAFADVVQDFGHLHNFRPKPMLRATAHFTSSQTGNHFLTPGDFATIYDLKPLYAAGFDGTGITIAVTGQTLINVARANTFRSLSGLTINPPQLFLAPNTGASQVFSGDVDEANIDVEWSGGVAKGASVLFDYSGATGSVFDALNDAIDNDRAPVVSISYGNCESMIGSLSFLQSLRTLIQQGVSQGQTLSSASGDEGAADCEASTSTSATTGLAVDAPGVIPEVTSVGGSEFTGDGTAGSDPPYWAAATSSTVDNISSALTYIPEMAWNDTNSSGLSAGGGGKSTIFTKPAWQTPLTPADGQRDVPDVSLNGSDAHDSYLVCSELDMAGLQSCATGFRDSSGGLDAFGGTSVSAQAFAGILAIISQATHSNGVGNANIEIYALAGTTPAAFHDITTGNNIVPCQSGTPTTAPAALRCPTTAPFQIGYSAGTGYDLATGLGSVDVNNLVRAWPGFSTAPAGAFSISSASATVAIPGGSGSSTITVTPSTGFTGTVTLSCASPGSEIACSFTQPTAGATTAVTITNTSSQTATLSITTTAAHAKSAGLSAKSRPHGGFGWFAASGGALLAGFFAMGVPSRQRRWTAMLGLLFCVFLAVGVGCGGSSSSGGGGGQTDPGTPAGTYTLVVTGTSGTLTQTANVTITVQ